MADPTSTPRLAFVSFAAGAIGCLVAVALPALYAHGLRQEPTGVSAGLAVLFYAIVAGGLGCLSIGTGVVALRQIRAGGRGGRGWAWTGMALGCTPFLALVGYLVPAVW